jgi:hypothetical protein
MLSIPEVDDVITVDCEVPVELTVTTGIAVFVTFGI